MILLATFEWLQEYPTGGLGKWVTKNEVIIGDTEADIKDEIDNILNDNQCGYRKYISLKELKRI